MYSTFLPFLLSLSSTNSLPLSLSVALCLFLSLSVSVCPSVSVCLSVCLSVSPPTSSLSFCPRSLTAILKEPSRFVLACWPPHNSSSVAILRSCSRPWATVGSYVAYQCCKCSTNHTLLIPDPPPAASALFSTDSRPRVVSRIFPNRGLCELVTEAPAHIQYQYPQVEKHPQINMHQVQNPRSPSRARREVVCLSQVTRERGPHDRGRASPAA